MNDSLNRIRVLPDQVIAQIAAGEVVERPASVVKELMENSVDAGARHIEIEIKEGGQKLIEISDDGIGMTQQDALLAFSQHATSKISATDDLDRLSTLGFRGEALASIASVSRTTLVTRREELDIGTRVTIEGGHVKLVENIAHPRGTRIQVRNLFFNVPARRKFMKSQQAEMAQISDVVCHYILAYPELAFQFTRGNVPVTTSNGSGSLFDAVLAVYGADVARTLLPIQPGGALEEMGAVIQGFISPPNQAKPSSRYMTTLVNRRYVRSKLLTMAIGKALGDFFPKGKYPVLVFDFRMPPELVDVNVHPQKTEVRFRDERWVFSVVCETIRKSLSGLKIITPQFGDRPAAGPSGATKPFSGLFSADSEPGERTDEPWETARQAGSLISSSPSPAPEEKIYHLRDRGLTDPPPEPAMSAFEPVTGLHHPRLLCQFMNSYILGEDQNGLFIIDQHAAHERILFDTYAETYQDLKVSSQALLFPIPLRLLPSERLLIKSHLGELETLGFTIIQEDDGQFYATGIPVMGNREVDGELVQDLVAKVLGGWETKSIAESKVDLLKIMACRAAVKAGDPLQETEMKSLFEQMQKTRNPFTCPHGRPTVLRISQRQIEHGFLRI
jgi:DNA mismatch repair protein MutL